MLRLQEACGVEDLDGQIADGLPQPSLDFDALVEEEAIEFVARNITVEVRMARREVGNSVYLGGDTIGPGVRAFADKHESKATYGLTAHCCGLAPVLVRERRTRLRAGAIGIARSNPWER
jgi:hypothetical protein